MITSCFTQNKMMVIGRLLIMRKRIAVILRLMIITMLMIRTVNNNDNSEI